MAQTTTAPSRLLGLIAAPFALIGRMLVTMAEAGPRMKQIQRLNEMSDADLEALGTTRPEMVRKIFGGAIYM